MQTNYEDALIAARILDSSPAAIEVGTQILTELVPVLMLVEAFEAHLQDGDFQYDAGPAISDAKAGIARITKLARAMKCAP